jgi:hypothetical protein
MPTSISVAGQRSGVSITPRDVLFSLTPSPLYQRGTIDASNAYDGQNTGKEDELRAGLILAMITSSKLWVPVKRTTANGAGSSATALIVVNASAFKAGETLKVGSNSGCVISSINYGTNTITLSAAKTWSSGDAVYCDSLAGSEIARGVLNDFVKLKDEDGTARNKVTGKVLGQGLVDNNQILSDLAAIRADTGAFLAGIRWGDQQGQT